MTALVGVAVTRTVKRTGEIAEILIITQQDTGSSRHRRVSGADRQWIQDSGRDLGQSGSSH